MKTHVIISFLLLLSLTVACKQNATVIIKGKVIGHQIPEIVVHSNPETGTCYFGFRDSVLIDSAGCFEIALNIEKPVIVQLGCGTIYQKFLIVEKEQKTYNIEYILDDKDNEFKVKTGNPEGQNAINSFTYSLPNAFKTIQSYDNDILTLEQVFSNIEKVKEEELYQLKVLLDNKKITNVFYEIAKNDRDCYFLAVKAVIGKVKLEKAFEENNKNELEEIKSMLENTFSNVLNEDYLPTSYYDNLLESYLYFKILESFDFNFDNFVKELTGIYEKDEFHSYFLNESKKYYQGEILAFFEASYIWIETLQKNYEKEFIPLVEEFKEDYPNSIYTRYLEPMIISIIKYHEKASSEFPSDLILIEDYQNLNNLSEALELLKGHRVLIDVWATWCGPCKTEFQHKEKLEKLLKKLDVEMLYISIDKDERASQWENMIKYYDLEGYHIRANKKLDSELRIMYDSEKKITIAVPFYLLADENGKIIKKHLHHASEFEKLEMELLNIFSEK